MPKCIYAWVEAVWLKSAQRQHPHLFVVTSTSAPSSCLSMAETELFGGYKQKLAQMQAGEPKPGESHLASKLLSMWAWGTMSAPTLQALANAAYQDGLTHPQIQRMCKIGGSGQHPGNMQRDLLVLAGESTTLKAAQSVIDVRIKTKKILNEVVKLNFILPHKLFSCMFELLPDAFQSSVLGGDAASVPRFWAAMKNHPVVTSRPELRDRKDLNKVVPIGLHGDGVTYMQTRGPGGKALEVLSWTSLLTKGPTKVSSFLMFLLVKNVVKDVGVDQTWPKVWKVLCWSLQALLVGTWPLKDWDNNDFAPGTIDAERKGTPLAEGFCAMVFILKSDLEFLSNHFHLNSPASNSPCALCQCDRSMDSRPWTDCRPTANWRATCWGAEDWAAVHPSRHTFFKMAGSGLDLIYPDLMHCKHLGTDLSVMGSVLTWLIKHYLKGLLL